MSTSIYTNQDNSNQEEINNPAKFSEIISGHNHSFDTGIALELGINAAIIYNHIYYWIERNSTKKDAEMIEGRYWMYESQKEIADFLGYLSEDEVQRAIKKLIEAGLIVKKKLNKNVFDRTNWYSVTALLKRSIKKTLTKPQNCGIGSCASAGSDSADPRDQIPQNDGMYKEQNNNRLKQDITTTTTPPPPKDSEIGGGGYTKIVYRDLEGKPVYILESEIFRHFLASPFDPSVILMAIEEMKKSSDLIRNVFKYLEAICVRITNKKNNQQTHKTIIDNSHIPDTSHLPKVPLSKFLNLGRPNEAQQIS